VLFYLINCISKIYCFANRSVSVTMSYSFEGDRQCHVLAKSVQFTCRGELGYNDLS
jgi:hypothetical protein